MKPEISAMEDDSETISDPARPMGAVYAASFGQSRFWFAQQLEAVTSTYHVPMGFRIRGALVADTLQRAVDAVTARHEILRTYFVDSDGVLEQVVSDTCRIVLDVQDCAAESELSALADRVVAEPIDVTAPPLTRIVLIRLAPDDHALILTLHHTITDAWSNRVLGRELSRCYDAFVAGVDPDLPELEVQYGDFAEWQRDTLAAGRWRDQAEFWRAELAGWPTELELPTDKPRPPVRTSGSVSVPFRLSTATAAGLRTLAREFG
ncbi:condensation domain-containing protein, partial [Nocardia sienata]|uniref:condensation domain-containing protein n=1 Tax=Nocardia sienata TaxID=248552 RepID=UPI001FDFEE5C